jgi:hypothetical protein
LTRRPGPGGAEWYERVQVPFTHAVARGRTREASRGAGARGSLFGRERRFFLVTARRYSAWAAGSVVINRLNPRNQIFDKLFVIYRELPVNSEKGHPSPSKTQSKHLMQCTILRHLGVRPLR